MEKLILFLTVLFSLGLSSCDKQDAVWVMRHQAGCCNPWDVVQIEDLQTRISIFLEQNDIEVEEIELQEVDVRIVCITCCGCPTDKLVRVKVHEEQLGALEELGFFPE